MNDAGSEGRPSGSLRMQIVESQGQKEVRLPVAGLSNFNFALCRTLCSAYRSAELVCPLEIQ